MQKFPKLKRFQSQTGLANQNRMFSRTWPLFWVWFHRQVRPTKIIHFWQLSPFFEHALTVKIQAGHDPMMPFWQTGKHFPKNIMWHNRWNRLVALLVVHCSKNNELAVPLHFSVNYCKVQWYPSHAQNQSSYRIFACQFPNISHTQTIFFTPSHCSHTHTHFLNPFTLLENTLSTLGFVLLYYI